MIRPGLQKKLSKIQRDPLLSAKAVGLRYVNDTAPGLTRRRWGKHFHYVDGAGNRCTDEQVLQRIKKLALPPAWAAQDKAPEWRSWEAALQSMEFLESLPDEAFATVVSDWIDRNGRRDGRWRPYPLSIRVVEWMQQLAARRQRLDAGFTGKADFAVTKSDGTLVARTTIQRVASMPPNETPISPYGAEELICWRNWAMASSIRVGHSSE